MTAPAGGLVLCLGSDGHVELGSPSDGCEGCSEPGQTPGADLGASGLDTDPDCCPCLDVPVMADGSAGGQCVSRAVDRPALSGPFIQGLGSLAPPSLAGRRLPVVPPPPRAGFALTHLRSVILII